MRLVTDQSTTAPAAAGASLVSTSGDAKCSTLAAESNDRPVCNALTTSFDGTIRTVDHVLAGTNRLAVPS